MMSSNPDNLFHILEKINAVKEPYVMAIIVSGTSEDNAFYKSIRMKMRYYSVELNSLIESIHNESENVVSPNINR